MNTSFKGQILRASVFSTLLTLSVLIVVFININKMIELQKKSSISQALIGRIRQIITYMVDMETGERGFLISGDMAYLEPYNLAEGVFNEYVRETKKLIPDDAATGAILDDMVKQKEIWIETAAVSEMTAKRKEVVGKITYAEFVTRFKATQGKAMTDAIRALAGKISDEQAAMIETLGKENINRAKNIRIGAAVVVLTMIFGFLLILWATSVVEKMEMGIRSANRTITTMLDSMSLAVFVVSKKMEALAPVSRFSTAMFGSDILGKNVFDFLYSKLRKGSEPYAKVQSTLISVFGEGEIQWDMVADNLPADVGYNKEAAGKSSKDEQALNVTYSPLWDESGKLEKILFVVNDVTKMNRLQKEADQARIANAENNQIIQEISELSREIIGEFLTRMRYSINNCSKAVLNAGTAPAFLDEVFRDLHTLKGNARSYKLSIISSEIHEVESSLEQIKNTYKNAPSLDSESIGLLSQGMDQVRAAAGKYSKIAQKIYGISDHIHLDIGSNIHKFIWDQQLLLSRINILLGRQTDKANNEVKACIKDSWSQLVRYGLIGRENTSFSALTVKVDSFEKELTTFSEISAPTLEDYRGYLAVPFMECLEEASKILLVEKSLVNSRTIEDKAFLKIYAVLYQLSLSETLAYVVTVRELATYCESLGLEYLSTLFQVLEDQLDLSDYRGLPTILRLAWEYLALLNILDPRNNLQSDEYGHLFELIQNVTVKSDGTAELLAKIRKFNCLFSYIIINLREEGIIPKLLFSTFMKYTSWNNTSILPHGFIGFLRPILNPEGVLSIFRETFLKESTSDVQHVLEGAKNSLTQPLNCMFEGIKTLGDSEVPTYLLKYELASLLKSRLYTPTKTSAEADEKMVLVAQDQLDDLLSMAKTLPDETHDFIRKLKGLKSLPAHTILTKMPNMVADIAKSLGKEVSLYLKGTETLIDRHLLKDLSDVLVHIIRNSLDHGIETAAVRLQAGKPPMARLDVEFLIENDEVLTVVIRDDGQGIDTDKVAKSALKKGIVSEAEMALLTPEQAVELIFAPGFSTASQVTELSGRGIGLDVVKATVQSYSGKIEVHNNAPLGLELCLKFPTTV